MRGAPRERPLLLQPKPAAAEPPADVDGLLKLTREPQFVSAAYFLRFKFEPGRYALAGREPFEGRTVLRDRGLP